ncbi:Methionyl-tRNA formyltransferase [Buchnera aphidicola (Takecallis arundicolens)]|uniref:methionyl-tRNA formyltransferase n=1 Tax=Buchnera aphidicola TaxID=9 RepID=UPI00346392F8
MNDKKKKIKIIFAGTPHFAACHLETLITSKHIILGILTQPDRPNKRGNITTYTPVKTLAKKYKIPVFQPIQIQNTTDCTEILNMKADIMIVVAYGVILPKFLLNAFPMGCINVHASLLPHWRGAAPIQWAILKGEKKTGITIIQMEEKLDAGKILYTVPCNILNKDTTNSLLHKLSRIGSQAILIVLKKINNKSIIPIIQDENKVTYATKLSKLMGKINFFTSAKVIERMIRAFHPWPGTYIEIKNIKIKIYQAEIIKSNLIYQIGQIIKINKYGIQIQTKKNILNIQKIQIPGKKIHSVCKFIQTKNKLFQVNQILTTESIK